MKTKKEINYIRKSCEIADEILQECIDSFDEFNTEKGVYDFLRKETKERGLKNSFKPIVANGWHGAAPHHKAKKTKLKKGFTVLDFGVKYKGYCSDITRTVYLGTPSKKEKKVYNIVLNAEKKAIKEIKPGMKCKEIYEIAADALGKYSKYFIHRLGHGMGLRIHEGPSLGPKNHRRLKENTVLTIEPGVYIKKKFGIRIEDTILLGKKTEVLTSTKKNLICINK